MQYLTPFIPINAISAVKFLIYSNILILIMNQLITVLLMLLSVVCNGRAQGSNAIHPINLHNVKVPHSQRDSQHIIYLNAGELHINQHLMTQYKQSYQLMNNHYDHTHYQLSALLHNRHLLQLTLPYHIHSQADQYKSYLIHIKAPIVKSTIDSINEYIHPYTLSHYIRDNTYIVSLPASLASTLHKHHSVLFMCEFHPDMKIDRNMHDMLYNTEYRINHITNKLIQHKTQHKTDNPVDLSVLSQNTDITLAVRMRYPTIHSSHLHTMSHVTPVSRTDTGLIKQYTQQLQQYYAENISVSQLNQVARFTVINSHTLHIKLSAADVLFDSQLQINTTDTQSLFTHIIQSIQQHDQVEWIELKAQYKLYNKYAKRVIQSGHKQTTPLYDHGLTGAGQIIGIGDTGIDYDNCFFYDPNVALPVNRLDLNHRKIIYYQTVLLNPDQPQRGYGPATDEEGHGTHTAGSVAGKLMINSHIQSDSSVLNELMQYNGVASDAKLIVWDISNPRDSNLYVPDDVYHDYLQLQQNLGAYISSNSWGDDSGYYDSFTHDVDQFIYDNQQFTLAIAGGNTGDQGTMTIGSPACGKNVLTVGASLNSAESFFSLGYNSGIHVNSPHELISDLPIVPAAFGPRFAELTLTNDASLVAAEPFNGCTELTNIAAVQGKVVLIQRGSCSFVEKARHALSAGASMMLVANNDAAEPEATTMGSDPPYQTTLVCAMLNKRDSDMLTSALQSNKQIQLQYPYDIVQANQNEANVAVFSGKGPTKDGRIKPDVLAPGRFIRSVHSTRNTGDYICDMSDNGLEIMEGTSMATPIAAGGAALVREYYMSGRYDNTPLIPSSALIKASMIHSTNSVGDGSKLINSAPSVHQGYGRLQLDCVLKTNASTYKLYINDTQSLHTGEFHSYCFKQYDPINVRPSQPFKATLVWSDPPAAVPAYYVLVNNLDLMIMHYRSPHSEDTQAARDVFIGNHMMHTDNSLPEFDIQNNVEQIEVNHSMPGIIRVVVRGTSVPVNQPQPYALVVTGLWDGDQLVDCPSTITCLNACSGHGTCQTSTDSIIASCQCEPHYVGADCSVHATHLDSHTNNLHITIQPESWLYYTYDVDDTIQSLQFRITRSSNVGDPDFYLAAPSLGTYPTLAKYTQSNQECDTCGHTSHVMNVSTDQLEQGTYILGIWGYCCDASELTLSFDAYSSGHTHHPTPIPTQLIQPTPSATIQPIITNFTVIVPPDQQYILAKLIIRLAVPIQTLPERSIFDQQFSSQLSTALQSYHGTVDVTHEHIHVVNIESDDNQSKHIHIDAFQAGVFVTFYILPDTAIHNTPSSTPPEQLITLQQTLSILQSAFTTHNVGIPPEFINAGNLTSHIDLSFTPVSTLVAVMKCGSNVYSESGVCDSDDHTVIDDIVKNGDNSINNDTISKHYHYAVIGACVALIVVANIISCICIRRYRRKQAEENLRLSNQSTDNINNTSDDVRYKSSKVYDKISTDESSGNSSVELTQINNHPRSANDSQFTIDEDLVDEPMSR